MTIELRQHAGGVILPVKAQAGARRATISGIHNQMLKVTVTAVAEKGKANDAVIDVLCEELSLSRSQIELIAGATSRQKQFLVRGIDPDEILRRIGERLARNEK